jgi:PAS domain S-box-containing protein
MITDSFFEYILKNNQNATLILDSDAVLLGYNSEAVNFIPTLKLNSKINFLLNKKDSELILSTLTEAIKFNFIVLKKAEFSFAETQIFEILCSKFVFLQKEYFYFSFSYYANSLNRLVITDCPIESLPINSKAVDIINTLVRTYPYSIITKTRLSNEIDNLEEKIWLKNSDNKYVLVNNAYSEKLGTPKYELEGMDSTIISKTTGTEIGRDSDYFIFNSDSNIKIINERKTSSGKRIRIIKIPIINNNKVLGIINIADDLIFEKTTFNEESNEEFLEIFIIDEHNNIISYNPELCLQYDFTHGENLHKKHISEIFDDEFVSEIERYRNNFRERKAHKYIYLYRRNGEVINEYEVLLKKIINGNLFLGNISINIKNSINNLNNKVVMNEININIIPQPVFIYETENLRFLDVNDSALNLYGYKKSDFLKLDLTDLYTPEDIQTLLETTESINRNDIYTGPVRQKRSDGLTIIVDIYRKDIEYKGKNAHIMFIKKAEEKNTNSSDNFYKNIIEKTKDLVFILDSDGFINYANNSVIETLGYNKSDLDKRPMISLISDDNRAKFNSTILNQNQQNSFNLEINLKHKNGKIINSEVNTTPIFGKSGQFESYLLIINIKPEPIVKIEKEIIEKPSINTGSLDLDFLTHLFHEILTPINVIKGFAQELSESITNPTEEQEEAISIINENQKLLMRILDNASDYVALETKQIEVFPEQVVFIEIIEDLQKNLKELTESKNKSFVYGKISSSLAIQTDKYKLVTLLNLFLTFAINHSKESKIYISAYSLNADEGIISLKDVNTGITPDLHKKMKEILTANEETVRRNYGISRFTVRLLRKILYILSGQVEEVQRSGKVVEIGIRFPLKFNFSVLKNINSAFEKTEVKPEIPLAKVFEEPTSIKETAPQYDEMDKFVESKNENLEFDFLEDKQSYQTSNTETQELETTVVEPVFNETTTKPVESKFDLSKYSCLYLEDQTDSQILFKSQMRDLRSIQFAISFEDAIPLLEKNHYDFIVMDMNLQGEYNGLDALRSIQRMPGYKSVPVIAVTAYVLPGDREKFIKAGFSDFISKPVLRDKLVDVLKRIFT